MGHSNLLPGKLTPLQQKFCGEYLKDFNQTKAAIRAGYKKKNARIMASKLMTNTNVTERLVQLQNEIAEKHDLTPDGIILNLKNIRNQCFLNMDGGKNGPAYAMVAMRANELMGQHIGMWPKRVEIDHNFIIEEKKQAENQRKVFEIVDGFAASKSASRKKTPRLGAGRKKKTANA